MKSGKKNHALEGIKKEQLSQGIHLRIKRRVFTLEFKAEIVRHRKAENLSFPECGLRAELSRARMEVIKVIGQLGGYWLTVVVVPDPATN